MADPGPTRAGIIGCGFTGRIHGDAYNGHPNVQIVALCDALGKGENGVLDGAGNIPGEPLRLNMGEIAFTRDPDELIARPDIDIVSICTHTTTHKQLAIAALQAGKHVFCEKPIARHTEDAEEIARVVAQTGKMFMVDMCVRAWPGWRKAIEIVDSGEYGKVLSAAFRRLSPPPTWTEFYANGDESGGCLVDLATHDIDFVTALLGHPSSVFASGRPVITENCLDDFTAMLMFPGNITATIQSTWAYHAPFVMDYDIILKRATIRPTENGVLVFQAPDKEPTKIDDPGTTGWAAAIDHFVECVRTNKPPEFGTVEEAIFDLALCEAINKSDETAAPVSTSRH